MHPEGEERPVLRRVALLSADPWDEVWRRNQHLTTQLVRLGLAKEIVYVNPPMKFGHVSRFEPEEGVSVVTPHLLAPRRRGGLRLVAAEVRRLVRAADALWINDAVLGRLCLRPSLKTLYDVTDDWRTAPMSLSDHAILVAAEDHLASTVHTTVCSEVLAARWRERYGIDPPVVQNGADVAAHLSTQKIELEGAPPHLMYVGTLHDDRLDLGVISELAQSRLGTVHLVGPDHLSPATRGLLGALERVILHGRVPFDEVPSWMAAADVLICPHSVTDFTLSLDAIKSFEYLASGRPVVATPTSGFQTMTGYPQVDVVEAAAFTRTVGRALQRRPDETPAATVGYDWAERAREFALQLVRAEVPRA